MDINKLASRIVWEEIEASHVMVLCNKATFQVEVIPGWDQATVSLETLAAFAVAYADKGVGTTTGAILINPKYPVP